MTRAELQRIRAAALAQAKEAQPATEHDFEALFVVRAWLALAQAADNLDAQLARGSEPEPVGFPSVTAALDALESQINSNAAAAGLNDGDTSE